MRAVELYRSLLKKKNHEEYCNLSGRLHFLDEQELYDHKLERDRLLELTTSKGASICYRGTKTDCRKLSAGCITCGEGSWSCLFINGICNAKCFYCPSGQKDSGKPVTNTLEFPEITDYIGYLERFGFRGTSISGGEPFLSFERSLRYITEIRKHFGDSMYIWLYTNGILVDEIKLEQLRDGGLDEIRFDLGARRYKTDKVEMAAKIIPIVTVEIPAVPEHYSRVRALLPKLAAAGVNHINLHQLRLTEYNARYFLKKKYTYLHGNKITVAESELTALRLLADSMDLQSPVPVNYCSFVYKNRYQGKAARIRTATVACKPFEEITRTGYIRSLYFSGSPELLAMAARKLEKSGITGDQWYFPDSGSKMFIKAHMMHLTEGIEGLKVYVRYFDTRFTGTLSYKYPFTEVRLNPTRRIFVEKIQCFADYELLHYGRDSLIIIITREEGFTGSEFDTIDKLQLSDEEKVQWIKITGFESVQYGLQL